MSAVEPRASRFERAMWKIDQEALGEHAPHSPRGLARRYLLAARAASEVTDDAVCDALNGKSSRVVGALAASVSRNVGDVATKLAVAIIESQAGDPGPAASILASVLADLVILADGPLPAAGVFASMTAEDCK